MVRQTSPSDKTTATKKSPQKQTYQYKESASILYGQSDEYELTKDEYFLLYSFFVTYSMCGKQSGKKRFLENYGWISLKPDKATTIISSGLKAALATVFNIDTSERYVFTDENNLSEKFNEADLADGVLANVTTERAVIGKTTQETNAYFKLFYRVRDGFAHGRFSLRSGEHGEHMIIIQDNDQNNVTARIVIKKDTLLEYVRVVDRYKLIQSE